MLETVAIVFGLSQIILMLGVLTRSGMSHSAERYFALLIICVAAEMLGRVVLKEDNVYLSWLLVTIYTGTAGIFWLLCYSVFDDHFELKTWQVLLIVATIILPLIAELRSTYSGTTNSDTALILLVYIPQITKLALLIHGIIIMLQYWRDDLVPARRRLRPPILLTCGFFILFVLFLRYILKIYTPWMYETQYILLALLTLLINIQLLRWESSGLFGETKATQEPQPSALENEEDLALVDQLQALMNTDKLYRKNGQTIGEVARAMQLPEYRLRQIINGQLGFRNFSDFLAHYRIQEAAQRIASAEERGVSVLNIALDTGYRSLSSFNKSFKEIHNMTPSQYRKIKQPQ